jgi:hypothetical protein
VNPYSLTFIHETDAAILVRDGLAGEFWLPKSQIEYDDEYPLSPEEEIDVEIPDWLAIEKGLA